MCRLERACVVAPSHRCRVSTISAGMAQGRHVVLGNADGLVSVVSHAGRDRHALLHLRPHPVATPRLEFQTDVVITI